MRRTGLRRFIPLLRWLCGRWGFLLLGCVVLGPVLGPVVASWRSAPPYVPMPRSADPKDMPLPRIPSPRPTELPAPREPVPEVAPVERPVARPGGPPRALACRAVDGDTLRCGAERVRLVGLDTPEMQGRCAAESRMAERAKMRLAALVSEGVFLQPQGRDRYDRLLAVVRDHAGRDLATVLIREGHARPYQGGPRAGWC